MKKTMVRRETGPETSEERERVILENLYLVRRVANRFARLMNGCSRESLVSAGTIGLIKAVDNFDESQSNNFIGYAIPMIVGEIRHFLRDRGWSVKISRQLHKTIGRIGQAVDKKLAQLGRYPTVAELGRELQLPEEVIIEGLEARNAYSPVSFGEEYEEGERSRYASVQKMDAVDEGFRSIQEIEDRIEITKALDRLSPIEQRIIILRFFEGKTQQQIAAIVCISQMHVSRLLGKSLKAMAMHVTGR